MPKPRELSVIIPAAAPGPRMRSWGAKPLVEIGDGQTILSRQVAVIRSLHPRAEVIVAAGCFEDRVCKAIPPGVKAVFNELYAETGVVRSIGLGLRVASHPSVLVVYGDLVFNHAAIRGVVGPQSAVLLDRSDASGDSPGATVAGGRVVNLDFGLTPRWAQVAYLGGRELELFKAFAWGPAGRVALGFEALNAVIAGGGRLRAAEPEGSRVVDVDTPSDIKRALEIDA